MFIPTTSLCSLSVNFTGLVLSAEQIVYRTADRRGRTQGGRPSVLRVRFMWHACCATGWPWPRVFCLSTGLSLCYIYTGGIRGPNQRGCYRSAVVFRVRQTISCCIWGDKRQLTLFRFSEA